MSADLSYAEALRGLVAEDELDAMLGLIESHKSWGAFRAKMPTHIVIALVDEVKRLREQVGGFKTIPEIDVALDLEAFDDDE